MEPRRRGARPRARSAAWSAWPTRSGAVAGRYRHGIRTRACSTTVAVRPRLRLAGAEPTRLAADAGARRQEVRDIDGRRAIGRRCVRLTQIPRCIRPRVGHVAMLAVSSRPTAESGHLLGEGGGQPSGALRGVPFRREIDKVGEALGVNVHGLLEFVYRRRSAQAPLRAPSRCPERQARPSFVVCSGSAPVPPSISAWALDAPPNSRTAVARSPLRLAQRYDKCEARGDQRNGREQPRPRLGERQELWTSIPADWLTRDQA
jgi:hypothetical protein